MIELLMKFYIFSFVGCFLECIWHCICKKEMRTKRMLLYLPMCPVYGLGAVLFTMFLSGFYDNILLVFILGGILASAAELLCFVLYLINCNVLVWNYYGKYGNVAGGICLYYSVLWGLLAPVYVYLAEPVTDYILSLMPEYLKLVTVVFLGIIVVPDMITTGRLFKDFGNDKIKSLPECFWYVSKNINKNEIFIKE